MAVTNLNRAKVHLNSRQRAAKPTKLSVVSFRRLPPSAMLLSVVLEYADLRDDMGGGRVMLRLSPNRLAEADIQAMLGDELDRAGEVAVIWDEREDEVFKVLEGAAATPAAQAQAPEPFNYDLPSDDEAGRDEADWGEDDELVLTPSAMRYLADHAARGGRRW